MVTSPQFFMRYPKNVTILAFYEGEKPPIRQSSQLIALGLTMNSIIKNGVFSVGVSLTRKMLMTMMMMMMKMMDITKNKRKQQNKERDEGEKI